MKTLMESLVKHIDDIYNLNNHQYLVVQSKRRGEYSAVVWVSLSVAQRLSPIFKPEKYGRCYAEEPDKYYICIALDPAGYSVPTNIPQSIQGVAAWVQRSTDKRSDHWEWVQTLTKEDMRKYYSGELKIKGRDRILCGVRESLVKHIQDINQEGNKMSFNFAVRKTNLRGSKEKYLEVYIKYTFLDECTWLKRWKFKELDMNCWDRHKDLKNKWGEDHYFCVRYFKDGHFNIESYCVGKDMSSRDIHHNTKYLNTVTKQELDDWVQGKKAFRVGKRYF